MKIDRPLKLRNKIQEYDWGSRTAIPSLLGLSPSSKPMAEMWMGAHPKAPSEVQIDGRWIRLDRLIFEYPLSILGKSVLERFSAELPFLFKVIAAEKPLSIQAHPNKVQAIEGFRKENMLGIPLDAPQRNYKDRNHKPEILCAITRFEVLKGFRPPEEIISLMEKAVPVSLKKELSLLKKNTDANGLKQFYRSIMKMSQEKKKLVIEELLKNVDKYTELDPAYSLVKKLNSFFPEDIGILSPLILNRIVLNPGEAIYIPAGQLHAYIEGVGIELMANSDNVLRGGLTHKHVDVDELINILNFDYGDVEVIKPEILRESEAVYITPAQEFVLSVIAVSKKSNYTSLKRRTVEILIFIDGKAEIKNLQDGSSTIFKKGDSVLIPSCMPQYEICGNATIYKASVPV